MDNTNALDYSKISHTQHCKIKTDPFQKIWFSWKSNCTYVLIKVPKKNTNLWVQRYFCNPIIWKPTVPLFQNTLTFAQYLFNSRSNMRVNIVHWNSLHSKKAILPTFSGQTPHFLGEIHKTRTYNGHHRKAWSVAVILSLRVGFQHIHKIVKYLLHCISQGLLSSKLFNSIIPRKLFMRSSPCQEYESFWGSTITGNL